MAPDPPLPTQKERIHSVSARLFSETGYRSTSMRDIAAAMGMKAGSLYTHISGKEEVLWEIIGRIADEFDAAVQPALSASGTAAERLQLALEAYMGVVTRNLEMATVLFTEWRQLPPERQASIAARRDRVEGVFRTLLQEGVNSGELAADTPVKLTAILALSGANWLPNWYQVGGSLSPQDLADAFAALLLKGALTRRPVDQAGEKS
ncbi:TetR/AcrR family transcriptional regulator (plasmid) [Deinococcus radiomollis]|uniref:TetR/AcrR family transcriptional regulator n=1 Tax=Deinococcus radiomollis TaxID=468916 RepID=UPI003892C6E4